MKTWSYALCLISLTCSACAQMHMDNLVLYYPLGANSQPVIRDFSGNKNGGVTAAVVASNSPSLVSMQQTRQLTLCLWIKPDSIPSEFPVLLSKGGNQAPGAYGGYELYLNSHGDNDLGFVSGPFEIDTIGANGKFINNHLGEWIHVAFTLNDATKTAKFYINGQPANDEGDYGTYFGSPTPMNFDVSNDLYLGKPDPASHPNRSAFDGAMQQVMIFNRALSAVEVQKVFSTTKPMIKK